ncbi:MAG: outer membrane lipid asymmetry maintenance protein MlaD [Rhodospirillales bacterium]
MPKMQRRTLEILVGLLVLAIGYGFVHISYASSKVKTVQGYALNLRFHKIGTIKDGAEVKVAGVTIGRVAGMRLDPGTFQVIMQITVAPDLKLPKDTKASITTDGLLGNKYVKIVPGQSKEMLKAGDSIAETKDAVSVEDLVTKIVQLAVGDDEQKK